MGVILLVGLSASVAFAARAWRPGARNGPSRSVPRERAAAAKSTAGVLLGDAAVELNDGHLGGGQAEAFRVRAQESGSTGTMYVYVGPQSTAREVAVGIYSNANGRPRWLLNRGVASNPKPDAWTAVPITPTRLVQGKRYWLTVLGIGGTLHYRSRAGAFCLGNFNVDDRLQTLPRVWRRNGHGTRARCPISAYVVAGGAALVPSLPESQSTPLLLEGPPIVPAPSEQLSITTPAPANGVLPVVSGSAVEGQTLTASTGTWSGSPTSYAYQWQDCNTAGEACSNITGATSSAYKLVSGDVGHTLRVVVTATNAGGSGKASSAASATVVVAAPVNSVLPVVSGSLVQGQTLTASTGSWSGNPTSYAYQWQDCNTAGEACSNITSATSAGYKLAAGDVGHTVRAVVTATNASGTGKASSAASPLVTAPPPAPANTALPVVSGSAVQGQTLTASTGTWSGSPTSYAYQWQDCNTAGEACSNITSATSSPYKLASSDVGHTLRVVVTATNAGGSGKATSAASAVVTAPPPAPTNTVLPAVSGSAVEGQTLTASTGSWSGSPTSYAYQWQDCNTAGEACSNITSATSASYKLAAGDVGHTVRAVVTAANAGGSGKASSAATATIKPVAPVIGVLPLVSGLAVEGQTLTASTGSWSGSPTSYSYQWEDCNIAGEACSNITSATSASYKLAAGDVGHTVRAVVTATNAGGSGKASSAASAVVTAPPPAPANTALPVLGGSAVEGQTLTASTGTWSGSPISYAYQWQDCNTAGEACSNIASATSAGYKLAAGDVGHTLRAVVTATNAGGAGKATSAASAAVVVAAPVNSVLPVVSGSAVEGQTLTASTGTWSGSPTSYAYQWEDCNTAGEACSNITSATSAGYKLAGGDVGHTVRAVVTATNAGGTGKASSTASPLVTAEGTTPVDCFGDPEGCGYPGPGDTGVSNCSALPKSSGTKTITKSETIENTNITGFVTVEASNVTMKHDCVVVNGGENIGAAVLALAEGADNFSITESTIGGVNRSSGSVGEGLRNNYSNPGALATDDRIENVGTPLHQNWTLEDSYLISNGEQHLAEQGIEHQEDWWFSNNAIVANHDTLLNPSKQTAVIFGETSKGPCSNHETITNSLLAGGGYMLYICSNSNNTNNGSTINIKNNRFARMLCSTSERTDAESRGGFECAGEPSELISYFDAGQGSGGYYPRGGFFGAVYEGVSIFNRGTGWEHNYWDNNLEEQPEETYCPKC